MQCPRCGLQNPPGIAACQRCGLPVYFGPPAPAPGYGPPADQSPPAGESSYAGQSPHGGQTAQPNQPYQPYGPSSQQNTPAYTTPYGPPAGSPYSSGPVAPYSPTATWPTATTTRPPGGGGTRLARLLLTVAALACLGYAAWAMTARRGIFADFADNRPVSLDHARSSDRTDTIFLVVAGALAVVALAFWLLRLASGKARSGGLAVVGFAMSVLGIACVVVGLVLSGMVGTGGSRADEGNKAATATIVTGSGFIALAIGLVIGLLVVRARAEGGANRAPESTSAATQGW
ncbi:MAG: hypothetical protein QOI06_2243 [Nocardioidaceae bacterium]|jgi:hypothetical protein|nr:hypothetical protein [Nocardioidaceae bacterium]